MESKKRSRDEGKPSSSSSSATTSSSQAPRGHASAAASGEVYGVFCSGLPYDSTEDDIRKFFTGCGDILSVRAPRYHDTGRSRGYAHVDFSTHTAMTDALKKDGRYIRDRFISVAAARTPGAGAGGAMQNTAAATSSPRPNGCTTLFVKGLPYEVDEAGLKQAFGRFGAITSVRISRWAQTHNSKGFGYVQFDHGFAADAAMKAYREGISSGTLFTVGGRSASLDWEVGAPKASFRTADNRLFSKSEEGKAVKTTTGVAISKPTSRNVGASVNGANLSSAFTSNQKKDSSSNSSSNSSSKNRFRDAGVIGKSAAAIDEGEEDSHRKGAVGAGASSSSNSKHGKPSSGNNKEHKAPVGITKQRKDESEDDDDDDDQEDRSNKKSKTGGGEKNPFKSNRR